MYKTFNSSLKPQLAKLKADFQLFEVLNKSIPVLMGIFIFFNPFPHTTSIKEICFYLSVFIVLVVLSFKKTKCSLKTPLFLPFGLFVGWAFLGLFFALNKENSIHDFYAHLLKYIVLYYILINFFTSRKRLVALSWIIIVSATIFSIGGLFYYYFILGNSLATRYALGLFSEIPTNLIGIVTVFAIILSLHHLFTEIQLYRSATLIICLFPLFAATLLTQARGTFLALTLAIILVLSKREKALIVLLSIIVIVVAVAPIGNRFAQKDILHDIRIAANLITFEILKDYPITGIGFGMQAYGNGIDLGAYNEKVPEKYRHKSKKILTDPHSMLPSTLVRLGFVGLVLFLYILGTFLRMCWRSTKYGKDDFIKNWGLCITSAFVAFFVIGIFEPVFSHVPEVVLFTIFAMMTILWQLNYNTEAN